jgi:hypothetical protein
MKHTKKKLLVIYALSVTSLSMRHYDTCLRLALLKENLCLVH